MKSNNYRSFLLMLLVSFIIMYSVMFLNVDKFEHIYISTTRVYMALLMVAPMAILMLLLMPGMFSNKGYNAAISISSLVVFILALTFLRNQTFVTDEAYMKAMIPHHSSAILVSKEANIKDPQLKKLSENIISSQEKEISEMKQMLKRMKNE